MISSPRHVLIQTFLQVVILVQLALVWSVYFHLCGAGSTSLTAKVDLIVLAKSVK